MNEMIWLLTLVLSFSSGILIAWHMYKLGYLAGKEKATGIPIDFFLRGGTITIAEGIIKLTTIEQEKKAEITKQSDNQNGMTIYNIVDESGMQNQCC